MPDSALCTGIAAPKYPKPLAPQNAVNSNVNAVNVAVDEAKKLNVPQMQKNGAEYAEEAPDQENVPQKQNTSNAPAATAQNATAPIVAPIRRPVPRVTPPHLSKSKDIQAHLYHVFEREPLELLQHERQDLGHLCFSESNQELVDDGMGDVVRAPSPDKENDASSPTTINAHLPTQNLIVSPHNKRTHLHEEKINDTHLIFADSEMLPDIAPSATPPLEFHSKFESGNLERVWRVPPEANVQLSSTLLNNQYILAMHFDTNTTNHSQWFYFGVRGMQPGQTYQFFIVNCIKGRKSMFTEGMKLCMYSERENAASPHQFLNAFDHSTSHLPGWRRVGENIQYYQNNYMRPESMTKRFWTLQFSYTATTPDDIVYFTQGVPYTYSYLQRYLGYLERSLAVRDDLIFRRELLCRSVGGSRCDVLTITSTSNGGDDLIVGNALAAEERAATNDSAAEEDTEEHAAAVQDLDEPTKPQKQLVVFSARVHPGETQASHMMHGTLKFLISDDRQAVELREKYIFVIVPMLNPDGIQAGNYRTNLQGFDLNRTWKEPDPDIQPTIYHTKRLIGELNAKQPVLLYVDYHGHARKKNIFIYGCNSKTRERMLNMRVYPHITARRSILSFADCKFNLFKSKMGAARCAIFKSFDIDNSYTIEASLCGPLHRRVHYGTEDYGGMGAGLARALLTYEIPEEREKSYHQLEQMFPEKKKTPPKRRVKSRLEQRFGRADSGFFDNRASGVEVRVKTATTGKLKRAAGVTAAGASATSGKVDKTTQRLVRSSSSTGLSGLGTGSQDNLVHDAHPRDAAAITKSSAAVQTKSRSSQSAPAATHPEPALITLKSLLVSSVFLLILRYLWKMIFGF